MNVKSTLILNVPVVRWKKCFHSSTCCSFATKKTIDPSLFRTFQAHSLMSHVIKNVLSFGFVRTRITSFDRATLSVSTKGSWGVKVLVGTASEDKDATPIFQLFFQQLLIQRLKETMIDFKQISCLILTKSSRKIVSLSF